MLPGCSAVPAVLPHAHAVERNVIRQDAGNNMLVELTQLRERVAAQQEQLNILEAYILSQT
jgi:hypothetical protein